MQLETAFYIVALIFMGIMLALITALVVAVFVIRAKLHAIEQQIADKLSFVTDAAAAGSKILAKVTKKKKEQ